MTEGSESGQTQYELTEEDQSRLGEIRSQLDDAAKFLDSVLMTWNHGPKEEYRNVEEVAKAVSNARDVAQRLT